MSKVSVHERRGWKCPASLCSHVGEIPILGVGVVTSCVTLNARAEIDTCGVVSIDAGLKETRVWCI